MFLYVSLGTHEHSFLLDIYTGVELIGLTISLIKILISDFLKWLYRDSYSNHQRNRSSCLTYSPVFGIIRYFTFSYPGVKQ